MSANHQQGPTDYNRAFAIGVGLNLVFSAVEAGYGIASGSLALVADAGHNLSDVLGLLLAWGASVLAARAATPKRTYGYRKASILAALGSAMLLLLAIGGMAWEAIGRIEDPQPVQGLTVIVVASIGVLINTGTALLFLSGQKADLNIRGAFLHLAADAAVSLGIVLTGVAILYTGWPIIDPVSSLVVALVILIGTWSLLRDSLDLALDAVPKGVDMAGLREFIGKHRGVRSFHDLHVWALSTTEVALSVHLVVNQAETGDALLASLQRNLHERFGINHITVQIETGSRETCALAQCIPDG